MTSAAARLVERWTHPVGTPVRYEEDDGSIIVSKTRSAAILLSNHTAVIWLEGWSACVALERVSKIEEGS